MGPTPNGITVGIDVNGQVSLVFYTEDGHPIMTSTMTPEVAKALAERIQSIAEAATPTAATF